MLLNLTDDLLVEGKVVRAIACERHRNAYCVVSAPTVSAGHDKHHRIVRDRHAARRITLQKLPLPSRGVQEQVGTIVPQETVPFVLRVLPAHKA